MELEVDGRKVEVPDDGASLLTVLRERLGLRSVKDGCSPQGQCGCCTVLVDGQPRVACVTPARRVRGRSITTLDGLPDERRTAWGEAFCATGASQCGFCTPGIVLRLEGLHRKQAAKGEAAVESALLAHLCRCTGWRTIIDAWSSVDNRDEVGRVLAGRDLDAASRRATIEGRTPQRVSADVPLGQGGFAEDTAPDEALVAVPDGAGGWAVGETLEEARTASGKVQGRRTTVPVAPPIELPDGNWDLALRTSWVEPAYLEIDATWCVPGGDPATPLANGGAFGGKLGSVCTTAARQLADEHGRAVRVVLSREDAVRMGAKRPPLAAGIRSDNSGVVRVARTPGVVEAIRSVARQLDVVEVDVAGPPTSTALRAAGWGEALILQAVAQQLDRVAAGSAPERAEASITTPEGATARAEVVLGDDPRVAVEVSCGAVLDEVGLRSYCVGAAHMGLSWVCSEGLAVDAETGEVHDLTIRSFGILRAVDMPPVDVSLDTSTTAEPINGSDAVFLAVAAATWLAQGLPTDWPTGDLPTKSRQ